MTRRLTASLRDRVFAKLEIAPDGCVLWTGSLMPSGYGQVGRGRRSEGLATVHRLMYEWFVGPIPDGLDLDHLCRNRACAAPAHLEPVTRQVNLLRSSETITAQNAAKTHCKQGHAFIEDNIYRLPGKPNWRACRVCRRAARQRVSWREADGLLAALKEMKPDG